MVDAVKGTISGRAIRGDRQICGPNTPRLTKSRKPVDIMLCPALMCPKFFISMAERDGCLQRGNNNVAEIDTNDLLGKRVQA